MAEYKLTKSLIRQIFLFLCVGFTCYIISILLLVFFVEATHLEVNLANVFASIITIFICYLLNAKFVFKSGRYSKKKEVVAFFTLSFFGFLLNVGLMFILTKYLIIWYVVAKTIVTLLVAAFNFIARKKFVFLN